MNLEISEKFTQIVVYITLYLRGEIYKRFYLAHKLNACSLFNYIKVSFETCKTNITKYIAQTYDGVAVVSGGLSGLQPLFSDEVIQGIHIHCYKHHINLILADVCENIPCAKEFCTVLWQGRNFFR